MNEIKKWTMVNVWIVLFFVIFYFYPLCVSYNMGDPIVVVLSFIYVLTSPLLILLLLVSFGSSVVLLVASVKRKQKLLILINSISALILVSGTALFLIQGMLKK